jgi:hypothetical protein
VGRRGGDAGGVGGFEKECNVLGGKRRIGGGSKRRTCSYSKGMKYLHPPYG